MAQLTWPLAHGLFSSVDRRCNGAKDRVGAGLENLGRLVRVYIKTQAIRK